MEFGEAFTQEAIDAANTDVDGEDEVTLRTLLQRVCEAQNPPTELSPDAENIAVLMFVAGRTYQSQFTSTMSESFFADANHALKTGMVLGVLLRNGIDALPGIDEDGDYTNVVEFSHEDVQFRVQVLP